MIAYMDEDDVVVNKLTTLVVKNKKNVIGSGESECVGYASVLRIPIIISYNKNEFKNG